MHSQYMYFELGMYFLMNTLLISLLVVPTLAKNMVYSLTSALLVKIWANLKAPPEGELQACWGPYTTPVITAILDVILKPMQSDSVGYWLFFLPNFRIIDQHLLLIWADLHVFYTIFNSNIRVK